MKKFSIYIILVLVIAKAKAQADYTLPSLRNTYQASYFNPAVTSKYKVSIGIPILSSIYFNNTRTGFTLQNVIDSKVGSLVDINTFQQKIKGDGIYFHTSFNTDIFHVSVAVGRYQLGFNSTVKVQTSQFLSKDFIGFLAYGNSYFSGRTADFKGVDVSNINYLENGISLNRTFDKLTVGVRVKYLQGITAMQTSNLSFGVTTPQNSYDPIQVHSGGHINTAGLPLIGDSIDGQPKDKSLGSFNASNLAKFKNNGWGLDLGATYKVSSKLTVQASIIDLGFIKWNSTPYNYDLKNANVQFDGFNDQHLASDSARNHYTDSLVTLLGQKAVTNNSFKTKLNTRFFVGADYNLTLKDRVGVLIQGQKLLDKYYGAYTLSYTRTVGQNWDLTTNYTIYNNSFANIGFGTSFKLGPVQLYLVSDDLFIYFKPNIGNILYFRFGLNLVFGDKDKNGKPKPDPNSK